MLLVAVLTIGASLTRVSRTVQGEYMSILGLVVSRNLTIIIQTLPSLLSEQGKSALIGRLHPRAAPDTRSLSLSPSAASEESTAHNVRSP